MGFTDAIRSVFSKYVVFSGRARRSEFWWFGLFAFILYLLVEIIDAAIGSQVLIAIVFLALLLPTWAVTVRRLHDTDRSGWWLLIGFIPFVGGIILLVFECQDSGPGTNAYGPSPKEIGGYSTAGPYGNPA